MAFQDFDPSKGLFLSNWVGFKHFIKFFTDAEFTRVIRNTIGMSLLNMIFLQSVPILFALFLNEVNNIRFRKTIQTISYLPHFVAYVVVANMFVTMLSPSNGIVNELLLKLKIVDESIMFLGIP